MIELQPFSREQIPKLIGWVESPEFLLQWAGVAFTYPLDARQLEKHLLQARGRQPSLMPFQAVLPASQEMVGYLELSSIDRHNRFAAVTRVLVGPQQLRGRGIGARMMKEVLRIAFEKLTLHRVYLAVFDFNQSAIACYEGVGFRKEGLMRECRRIGDRYWSIYMMSILEGERKDY